MIPTINCIESLFHPTLDLESHKLIRRIMPPKAAKQPQTPAKGDEVMATEAQEPLTSGSR